MAQARRRPPMRSAIRTAALARPDTRPDPKRPSPRRAGSPPGVIPVPGDFRSSAKLFTTCPWTRRFPKQRTGLRVARHLLILKLDES